MRPLNPAISLLLVCLCVASALAQDLRLNELMTSNGRHLAPNGNLYPWIELLNPSGQTTKLSEYSIASGDKDERVVLPVVEIAASDRVVIWFADVESVIDQKNVLVNFAVLNQEWLFLIETSNNRVVDSLFVRGDLKQDESLGRAPDGSNTLIYYTPGAVTLNAANTEVYGWTKVAGSVEFSPRDSSPNACVVHDDAVWVFGGYRYEDGVWDSKSDVWKSIDGVNWELINPDPPYSPYNSFVSFNGRLWAFGKVSFTSVDGVTWDTVHCGIDFGSQARTAVFKDKLWLINGRSIWSSSNGYDWTTIMHDALWEERALPGLLVYDNKLWFFGGGKNYFSGHDYYYRDVWSSDDGENWTLVTNAANWPGRYWFSCQTFDDKMWLIGGWNYYELNSDVYGNMNDVWVSTNGSYWYRLFDEAPWPKRHASLSFTYRNSLYISAGYGTGGLSTIYNDVWRISSKTYFAQPYFDLSSPNSWNSRIDGTGSSPQDFHQEGQLFIVNNGLDNSINKDLTIDGANSLLTLSRYQQLDVAADARLSATVKIEAFSKLTLANNSDIHFTYIDTAATIVYDMVEKQLDVPTVNLCNTIIKNGRNISLPPSVTFNKNLGLINTQFGGMTTSHLVLHENLTLDEGSTVEGFVVKLSFTGVGDQTVESLNETAVAIDTVAVFKGSGNLVFDCNVSANYFQLASGKTIVNKNAYINNDVAYTNSSYFITMGKGLLQRRIGGQAVVMPLGSSDSFNPLLVKNNPSYSARVISARAGKVEHQEGHMLDVLWEIRSDGPSASNIHTVSFAWQRSNEGPDAHPDSVAYYVLHPVDHYAPCNYEVFNVVKDSISTLRNYSAVLPGMFTIRQYKNTPCNFIDKELTYGDTVLIGNAREEFHFESLDPDVATFHGRELVGTQGGTTIVIARGEYNSKPAIDTFIVSVLKRKLHISVPDLSIPFASPMIEPDLTYTGFVNNDTPTNLARQPTLDGPYDYLSEGTYPLRVSGGEDESYFFEYTDGTLTVTKGASEPDFIGFPNPTADQITLVFSSEIGFPETVLINSQGEQSSPAASIFDGANKVILDLRDYPPGIYLLRLDFGDKVIVQRVVIK